MRFSPVEASYRQSAGASVQGEGKRRRVYSLIISRLCNYLLILGKFLVALWFTIRFFRTSALPVRSGQVFASFHRELLVRVTDAIGGHFDRRI